MSSAVKRSIARAAAILNVTAEQVTEALAGYSQSSAQWVAAQFMCRSAPKLSIALRMFLKELVSVNTGLANLMRVKDMRWWAEYYNPGCVKPVDKVVWKGGCVAWERLCQARGQGSVGGWVCGLGEAV